MEESRRASRTWRRRKNGTQAWFPGPPPGVVAARRQDRGGNSTHYSYCGLAARRQAADGPVARRLAGGIAACDDLSMA